MKNLIIGCLLTTVCHLSMAQSLNSNKVDNSTYEGKVMFGYQGWFNHPDAPGPSPRWIHWGNLSTTTGNISVDMYPDMREYNSDEKYATAYSYPSGEGAKVFASTNRNTVIRHMKWLRDYNTDGVFLQRFINSYSDKTEMEKLDLVASHVKEGCEIYGRVYGIMYDGIGNKAEEIKTDWMHLVDDIKVTEGESYLHHNGLPLVTLWGFTLYNEATVEQLEELIEFFHNNPIPKYRASIKLGVNDNWFNKTTDWMDALANVEVISPWAVGRYGSQGGYDSYINNQLKPSMEWCNEKEILYVPVVFPGFSWHNLKGETENAIPRQGGKFFWLQAYGAMNEGAKTIYVAMFDEVDEGTAMFKLAETEEQTPDERYWLSLDADGYDLPSDWYLRCAGKVAETLRGNIELSKTLGTPPEGIMSIRPNDNNCSLEFIFPDFEGQSTIEISLDGGENFDYSTPDSVGNYYIQDLWGTYNVFVRHPGMDSIPMGEVKVLGACGGTQIPFSENIIPGTIEAENFDLGENNLAYHDYDSLNNGGKYRPYEEVDIERTTDLGGGYNVGWINDGEWIEYTINKATAGTYTINFRVASNSNLLKKITVFLDEDSLGTVTVPNTGGLQIWQTIQLNDVIIPAGLNKTLRLEFMGGEFSLNYITAFKGQVPFSQLNLPGTIQAQNFDFGGDNLAFHDSESTNTGNAYRPDETVDIMPTTDIDGEYNITDTKDGEWIEYTINDIQTGYYSIAFRVASTSSTDQSLELLLDNKTITEISVPTTDDQSWETIQVDSLFIEGGTNKVIRLKFKGDGILLNHIIFSSIRTAYKAHTIPGTIEAEHFDFGGEGLSFHDSDDNNEGEALRNFEGVDIQTTDDMGGGYNVGWTSNGEWLKYTISDVAVGDYDIEFRVASINSDATITVWLGNQFLGIVNVPNTKDWQKWETVTFKNKHLLPGKDIKFQLTFKGQFNLNYIKFSNVSASLSDAKQTADFEIYPQPAKNKFSIRGIQSDSEYQIYSILGHQCAAGRMENNSISIQHLTDGIYILAIEGHAPKKFVIE